jgi:hypothetical protein
MEMKTLMDFLINLFIIVNGLLHVLFLDRLLIRGKLVIIEDGGQWG